jgi:hypothetical protein
MGLDLGYILQQYLGAGAQANLNRAPDDFDAVASQAPRAELAAGVTDALRSDQTPPFPNMVSQLFGQGDPQQRAGMLNQLLGSLGPGVLATLGGGMLGTLLGKQPGSAPHVTPEQAAQVTPEQVQQIAQEAERENPGIVDRMGDFYAQNPTLVKAVGGAALAIVLGRIAQGMRH